MPRVPPSPRKNQFPNSKNQKSRSQIGSWNLVLDSSLWGQIPVHIQRKITALAYSQVLARAQARIALAFAPPRKNQFPNSKNQKSRSQIGSWNLVLDSSLWGQIPVHIQRKITALAYSQVL